MRSRTTSCLVFFTRFRSVHSRTTSCLVLLVQRSAALALVLLGLVTFPTPTAAQCCCTSGNVLSFSGNNALTVGSYPDLRNTFSFEFWARPTGTHEVEGQTTGGVGGTSGQVRVLR